MTKQKALRSGRFPLLAGFLASVLSVACCVGPLLLVSLGLGGAWASRLAALDPYRPGFVARSVLFLGWGAWAAYRRTPASCGPGALCRPPVRQSRRMLWGILVLSLSILAFPWYAAWFFH
ncbi:MAG: mercuric transporter MerT family protein [Nitrospirota bacterium]|nr:mercuric transporter MerT family protein [Nitrospirota bacterium]